MDELTPFAARLYILGLKGFQDRWNDGKKDEAGTRRFNSPVRKGAVKPGSGLSNINHNLAHVIGVFFVFAQELHAFEMQVEDQGAHGKRGATGACG